MKKLIALIVLASILFSNCQSTATLLPIAQEKLNRTYLDSRDQPNLIGQTTETRLKQAPFDTWFSKYYDAHEVKKDQLASFKHQFKDIKLTIFMATWCRDSRREVPRFLKIMDYLKFPKGQMEIVNLHLDGKDYKKSPDHEEKGLNIHRVPTFIFSKDGKEMGRIVEKPTNTFETDIAQIFLGAPSRPQYRAVTAIQKVIKEQGISYLKEQQKELATKTYYTARNSNELNNFGYLLLKQEQKAAAVAIFEINALAFPKDANVFDSLAEGYIEIGKNDLAIQNYTKVLELSPDNENAIKMLEKLKKERS